MLGMGTQVLLAEGRIFGLDAQLIHDALILGVNIFIVFMLASYLLFKPARELLKKRQDAIQKDIDDARAEREKADAMVAEYTEKLEHVDDEAEEILSDARRRAKTGEAKIIADAHGEAGRIIRRAEADVELERIRALEDVKQEMIDIASVMAEKAVSGQMNADIQEGLVDETIRELNGEVWQKK